ncbi:MAG: UTP--glucose-1-phosphate uridylyltransferase [Bifidobacteriaceae bacterium]|nr:UTP--glucose-1-phosphate uridylyltransferase [Bifidobacteriaceae bacterium]
MGISKAVIPAAGLGTRFLPATKAVPKELLPVVDVPAIQYVVAEAAAAGLTDILIVTGRGKDAIADHFDRAPDLERMLDAKGDAARLAAVRVPSELATVHTVRQGEPHGLGHAVWCARDHVGGEPFAVLLGDDLIDERDPLLTAMLAVQRRAGGSVITLMPVSAEQIALYGCAGVAPSELGVAPSAGLPEGDVVRVEALVEKPTPSQVLSHYAVIGRYVLHPAVFDVLERQEPGRGGEIQLTDAIATLATMPADQGGGVHGVVFRGRRYDTGDKLDYLKAVVCLASRHPDVGGEFRAWLTDFARSPEE